MTIGTRLNGVAGCDDITATLPHTVGGQGALASIPLPLANHEQEALRRSVGILREAIESLKV